MHQGIWFGLLIAVGSLGRMTAPLYMTPLYNEWGLYALGLLLEVGMAVTLVLVLLVYKELVPLEMAAQIRKEKELRKSGSLSKVD